VPGHGEEAGDFLLGGTGAGGDGLVDEAAAGDLADEVVDDVLVLLEHAGDGGRDRVGLADEKLVADEADQGGVLGGVVEVASGQRLRRQSLKV